MCRYNITRLLVGPQNLVLQERQWVVFFFQADKEVRAVLIRLASKPSYLLTSHELIDYFYLALPGGVLMALQKKETRTW